MSMRKLLVVILLFGTVFDGGVYGKTLEEETPVLVQTLAKQLVAKKRPKVAALDFTDIQGQPNELGRFVAEQLAVDMVTAEGITVLDRANISSIMAEHQLTAEGLVKPENAKKLGQFAGVDAILIGNLAPMENMVTLTVKAISTETAEVVAAGRMKFDITKDIQHMLGLSLSNRGGNGGPSSATGGSGITVTEGDNIATRELGPLIVILKNVVPVRESVRFIRCTFELQNRDLRQTVAIAANATVCATGRDQVERPDVLGSRSGLVDSLGNNWGVGKGSMKGMSEVSCFEALPAPYNQNYVLISQNSPGSIVNYIRRGKHYDFSKLPQTGMSWAGSFSTIPPGKSIRVTLSYLPAKDMQPNNRRSSSHDESEFVWPEYFQLDLELVVGCFFEGQEPEMAKDLALQNLTIDKVVLPKAAAIGGK